MFKCQNIYSLFSQNHCKNIPEHQQRYESRQQLIFTRVQKMHKRHCPENHNKNRPWQIQLTHRTLPYLLVQHDWCYNDTDHVMAYERNVRRSVLSSVLKYIVVTLKEVTGYTAKFDTVYVLWDQDEGFTYWLMKTLIHVNCAVFPVYQ